MDTEILPTQPSDASPTDQDLLAHELAVVERKSQLQANLFLGVSFVALYVLVLSQLDQLPDRYYGFIHAVILTLVAWFMASALSVHYGFYHRTLKYVHVIVQVSVVSFLLMITAAIMGAEFALSSSVPLFYVVVIGITSLTMNPFLCLLAGGFAAGQFLGLYGFWLHDALNEVGKLQFTWASIILRASIFLLMGVAAMVMARKARSLLETVVTQVRYAEQLWFLETDIRQAAEIQTRLIPSQMPACAAYDIESYYRPSRWVGGDYYDIVERRNGKWLVLMADVSGKGFAAALLMSNIQAIVRTLAPQNLQLTEMVGLLNQSVYKTSAQGRFISLVCLELDYASQTLKVVNAGHNPPIVVRRAGGVERLTATGPVLGVDPNPYFEESTQAFCVGDLLFAYTDGLSELRGTERSLLGETAVVDTLVAQAQSSSAHIKQGILKLVDGFTRPGNLADDLSFLCIKAV